MLIKPLYVVTLTFFPIQADVGFPHRCTSYKVAVGASAYCLMVTRLTLALTESRFVGTLHAGFIS